ncbi:type II toxin-antitoxin system HicA family toxin [Nesterenkonia rhizosphaerae]
MRKLIKALEDAGYEVVYTKKGHPVVLDQEGRRVTTFSGTPSDRRSWLNQLAPLKRRGFDWPPRR